MPIYSRLRFSKYRLYHQFYLQLQRRVTRWFFLDLRVPQLAQDEACCSSTPCIVGASPIPPSFIQDVVHTKKAATLSLYT